MSLVIVANCDVCIVPFGELKRLCIWAKPARGTHIG